MQRDVVWELAKKEADADAEVTRLRAGVVAVEDQLKSEAERLASAWAPEDQMSELRRAGAVYKTTKLPVVCGARLLHLPLRYPRHLPRGTPMGLNAPTIAKGHKAAVLYDQWQDALEVSRVAWRHVAAEYMALYDTKTVEELCALWPAAAELYGKTAALAAGAERRLKERK